MLPVDDPIISFTSSGSESNELAFKIVRAYHSSRGDHDRVLILSRDGSYHGSTYGGMSATGSAAFRAGFGPMLPGFAQVAQPSPGRCGYCTPDHGCTLRCADALELAIESHGRDTVAAIIAEPVSILGAVKVPHPEYWSRIQEIKDRAGALLVVDEVVTGFGRTGRMFGSDHWDIKPDVMTLAKGLTSGYAPLGATVITREVEEPFASEPLLHLNTYAAHPVSCEAALANIEILMRERLAERAAEREPVLRRELETLGDTVPRLLRVAAIGLLSSVELDIGGFDDPDTLVIDLRHVMYEHGLIARVSHAADTLTVVFYPALVVSEADVVAGVHALRDALARVLGSS
jgi:adenosylmethionine-8-amino-7-oxononanoate aminotransferase